MAQCAVDLISMAVPDSYFARVYEYLNGKKKDEFKNNRGI